MFSAEVMPTEVYLSTPKATIAKNPLCAKVLFICTKVRMGPIFSRAGGMRKYLTRCSVPRLEMRIAANMMPAPTIAKRR